MPSYAIRQLGSLARAHVPARWCNMCTHHFCKARPRLYVHGSHLLFGLCPLQADVWSAACMAFELITGEYLFDPQEGRDASGKVVVYERDEDLLALQQELLGPIPLHLAKRGRLFDKLMTADGRLRRIPSVGLVFLICMVEHRTCCHTCFVLCIFSGCPGRLAFSSFYHVAAAHVLTCCERRHSSNSGSLKMSSSTSTPYPGEKLARLPTSCCPC